MRLQKITFLPTLVLCCAAFSLAACGDDGNSASGGAESTGTGTVTTTDTDPMPNTTEDSVDTTAGPGDSTTDDPTTGLDSTGGDSSSGSEDTTSGPMGDCGDGAGMSFSTLTSVDNEMITHLTVEGLVSCSLDVPITATGGTVCVVDDGADGFYYTVETLALLDVPPVTCGIAEVGLTNLSIENIGDGTDTVVPQAGGTMVGNQQIAVIGDVEGSSPLGPIGPVTLMDFNGVLPEGDAAFGADDTTATYADTETVIATSMPEVAPGVMVTVTLSGLTGSITLAQ